MADGFLVREKIKLLKIQRVVALWPRLANQPIVFVCVISVGNAIFVQQFDVHR